MPRTIRMKHWYHCNYCKMVSLHLRNMIFHENGWKPMLCMEIDDGNEKTTMIEMKKLFSIGYTIYIYILYIYIYYCMYYICIYYTRYLLYECKIFWWMHSPQSWGTHYPLAVWSANSRRTISGFAHWSPLRARKTWTMIGGRIKSCNCGE